MELTDDQNVHLNEPRSEVVFQTTSLLLNEVYAIIEYAFCIFALSVMARGYISIPIELSGQTVDIGGSDFYNRSANQIVLGV